MKIPGTKLDIPCPDGWELSYDTDAEAIALRGTRPDAEFAKNRRVTYILFVKDGTLNFDKKARRLEDYDRHEAVYDRNLRKWVATGKVRKAKSNVGYRYETVVLGLARGVLW